MSVPYSGTYTYAAVCRVQLFPCSMFITMKIKCWIGPLIAVIILLTLRLNMYEERNDTQSNIPAAEIKQNEISPPMAGTLIIRDTLPF
jgi:hypothetical protein